jgi:hypothetical protein
MILIVPGDTSAEKEEGIEVVNIETYVEISMDFSSGDTLHLTADIESQPNPVSVILLRGRSSLEDWEDSEEVDIGSLKNGSESMNRTSSFMVIENFSEMNTTDFTNTIDIGEHDEYFLIIALHRDDGMDADDVLSMATQVRYTVEWSVNTRSLNKPLLIAALVMFSVGMLLVFYYFISYNRARRMVEDDGAEEIDERPARRGVRPRQGIDRRKGGRAPPLR